MTQRLCPVNSCKVSSISTASCVKTHAIEINLQMINDSDMVTTLCEAAFVSNPTQRYIIMACTTQGNFHASKCTKDWT